MPRPTPRLVALLALAVLPACSATRGHLFTRQDIPPLEIGQTTRGEVSTKLGDPTTLGFAIRNQFQYDVYTYQYTEAKPSGVRSRLFRAGFGSDKKLAFYSFQSNFESDATEFDITKLTRLVPGRSKAADVRAALGEPGGLDFALVGKDRFEVWVYAITRLEDIDRPVQKKTALYFDVNGVLVWYEAQGDGFFLDQ